MSESKKADSAERFRKMMESDSFAFDNMMYALDDMFHVLSCPNHTTEERRAFTEKAFEQYVAFATEDFDNPSVLMGNVNAGPPPGTKLN